MEVVWNAAKNFFSIFNLKNHLIRVGGGNPIVVSRKAQKHESFFFVLGCIIYLVAIIATISATVATNAALGNFAKFYLPEVLSIAYPYISVLIGLLYGVLIFSLDRLIVTTCPSLYEIKKWHSDTTFFTKRVLPTREAFLFFVTFLLRLFIAITIAMQITTLLGVSLSQTEIYAKIKSGWVKEKLSQQNYTESQWKSTISEAEKNLQGAVTSMDNYYSTFIAGNNTNNNTTTSISVKSNVLLKANKYQVENNKLVEDELKRIKNTLDAELAKPKGQQNIPLINKLRDDIKKWVSDSMLSATNAEISATQAGKDLIIKEKEKQVYSTLEYHMKKVNTLREHLVTLQNNHNEWIKKNETPESLGKKFEECSSLATNCDMPIVGILSKVSEYKEITKYSDKAHLMELLGAFIILVDLISLLMKILVNKEEYNNELEKWQKSENDKIEFNEKWDDLIEKSEISNKSLATIMESRNETLNAVVQSTNKTLSEIVKSHNETRIKTSIENIKSDLFIFLKNMSFLVLIAHWMRAFFNPVGIEKIFKKPVEESADKPAISKVFDLGDFKEELEKIPSAYAYNDCFDHMSDHQSSVGLKALDDQLPKSEDNAKMLKDAFSTSFSWGWKSMVFSFLAVSSIQILNIYHAGIPFDPILYILIPIAFFISSPLGFMTKSNAYSQPAIGNILSLIALIIFYLSLFFVFEYLIPSNSFVKNLIPSVNIGYLIPPLIIALLAIMGQPFISSKEMINNSSKKT
jgi:hypothetical protein